MAAPEHPWHVERHTLLDSTNRLAMDRVRERWAARQPAEGIAIAADRQNAGRGQYRRRWESPEGGVYLSAVVEDIPVPLRGLLALLAGVAAAEGLIHSAGVPAGLRWPNDLMIADQKIGGILCESLAQGERWAAVVGIGVNVNTRMDDLPAGLRCRASSLLAHDGRRRNLRALEDALLESLFDVLTQARAKGLEVVIARARTLDVLRDRAVTFQDGEHTCSGVARGIGDGGELLIALDHGPRAFITGTLLRVDGQSLRE